MLGYVDESMKFVTDSMKHYYGYGTLMEHGNFHVPKAMSKTSWYSSYK